ncbi:MULTISPECIES: 4-(cytidine 5'-diphospho)-2-C-methyl-D-erythritol kinase [Vitreoscilla]|uniref:4-diphosphocytidyl-2-C-methyl-D-erythritol kinase n=1 Tax=Vitreoscilla stercoraria TaxID=61 RepID=A0ABY4EJZ5_VITST|nr:MULTISPECIES: 4-(cytidine 5'-diphospho)-2-C-methyl-D-erythritol kinase [Vitreoscilla]UOO93672.1 4-(cytidine 5'-diphospho)-2-C-methyl-D-erythritol kinase [Vitreoscilla stercoraria]
MNVPADAQAFLAPAKLNLMLHIVGRREDGYHLLETVFRFIGLYDTVHVRVRDDGEIVLHTLIDGVAPEQDLSVRAAVALKTHTGSVLGADLWVEKNIPMGGGLGGGSSDAATVLLALNQLWQTGLSRQELMDLGVRLGADVPVFIFGRNAFASGIGEILSEVVLKNQWYVVIKPNVHVQTAKIFNHERLTRDSKPSIMRILESTQQHRNDMQQVVLEEYAEVKEALDVLKQYGDALMTGSGACVFLPMPNESAAKKVYTAVASHFEAYCVVGLDKHPLAEID